MKKRKIGFRARFFLEVGAIIAACLVGISIINSQLLEKVYISNVERSLEDIAEEAGVSKTIIQNLADLGALNDLPDTNQISMF